ncbi:unnamed protein product [Parnassius apollo]|uniref:(apollo) hypothetical protein n=1 Tax=Parnassius apollo TaxID=110799 RepID=A0A8S3XQY1_PARAO|nr:unnamed protein product [Parnassius apollo]
MDEIQSASGTSLILKEDPESLLRLVNKYCTINLIRNNSFSGYLHSIDPISNSIILAVPHESTFQIVIIPGHAIINVSESSQGCEAISPFKKSDEQDSKIDIISRKSKVMEWLKLNFLPVSESNENIVIGNVLILPPYTVTDICTDNPIVAMQVRKIIEKIPQDS